MDLEDLAESIQSVLPRFDADQQHIALTLYRLLAGGHPVSTEALADRCEMPAPRVGELMGGWPDVFRDRGDRIVAFGGLSLEETRHRFYIDGRQLYTWCAWDALFIPELLARPAHATSRCPMTGRRVELTATPHGVEGIEPGGAVLSMRAPTDCCTGNDLIARFCQQVHFFASRAAAEQWLTGHADGFVLSIEQGVELGRITNHASFAEVLD